ncbi:MAG: glutamate racemase [Limnochordaceae bacterium]|nr:glutamate racemase [Limnochordaceae bacterium]
MAQVEENWLRPIGMFDSGVGGLSVARVLLHRFPQERLFYVGDTAHVPYGDRSTEELIALGDAIVRYLLSQQVRALVVACNTSSAVSMPVLRERYPDLPMVGMIEPGARAALAATRTGRIGLLATQATVRSQAYVQTLQRLVSASRQDNGPAPWQGELTLVSQAAPLLVPLIEAGRVHDRETRVALEEYLRPLLAADVDTLILGCTHYPFVAPIIQELTQGQVALVDPAQAVIDELAWRIALRTETVGTDDGPDQASGSAASGRHNGHSMGDGLLGRSDGNGVPRIGQLDPNRHRFGATGDPRRFAAAARLFLGTPVPKVDKVQLDVELPARPAASRA